MGWRPLYYNNPTRLPNICTLEEVTVITNYCKTIKVRMLARSFEFIENKKYQNLGLNKCTQQCGEEGYKQHKAFSK